MKQPGRNMIRKSMRSDLIRVCEPVLRKGQAHELSTPA
jgi:hypothetical protein